MSVALLWLLKILGIASGIVTLWWLSLHWLLSASERRKKNKRSMEWMHRNKGE
jgi:hypothetical protein